ncbi:MAG: tetratricopeptide repeat protein [Nitrospirales bacterium]|nr:tetratricopeptide repeat protein [Nitrospirales bacterium]
MLKTTQTPIGVIVGLSLLGVLSGCVTSAGPLATLPMVSPSASQRNLEGIQHYQKGEWEAARLAFETATQRDPTLPEAHFNLALTLHKLGKHEKAKTHFSLAGQLAPHNNDIVESTLYRNHLGLSSTLERHISGGYRY